MLGRRADVRRAQGPLQLRLPAPDPRGRARRPGRRAVRPSPTTVARAPRCVRAARVGRGDRDRRPATSSTPGATTGPGGRSRSATASAWARAKCPFGAECFAERARERARRGRVVVPTTRCSPSTRSRASPMIPEYDVVVIDEAHELVARVTQAGDRRAVRAEVDRAARRARAASSTGTRPTTSPTPATRSRRRWPTLPAGRIDELPEHAGRRAGAGPRRGPRR